VLCFWTPLGNHGRTADNSVGLQGELIVIIQARTIVVAACGAVALCGCLNMPTPTNQITGAYVSTLNYEQFDCNRLVVEQDSLSRRESGLAAAQEQRVKTSQMQAFWFGFGQGDSVEATELARVRGEKEAVLKAKATKGCGAS
jgi:hypothetical protein